MKKLLKMMKLVKMINLLLLRLLRVRTEVIMLLSRKCLMRIDEIYRRINILSQLMKLRSFAAGADVFLAKPSYRKFRLFQI